jgi:glutathione synthase
MYILFVCDPLTSFHTEKDSTFTMMREAQQRGHAVWACGTQDLFWQSGARVSAHMQQLSLTGDPLAWFTTQSQEIRALADVDAVIMRKDPPFDNEYFYATHLLSQAERDGARVTTRIMPSRRGIHICRRREVASVSSP